MPNIRGSDPDSAYTYILTNTVHDTYSNPGNIPYKKPQKPQGSRSVAPTGFNKNLTQSKGTSSATSHHGGMPSGSSNSQTVLTIQHTPAGPSTYQRAKKSVHKYMDQVNNRQDRLQNLNNREKNLQSAIATTTDATQLQTLKTQLKTVQAKEDKVEKRLGRAQRNLRRVQGNNPALIPNSTQQSANSRHNAPGKKQMGGAVRGNNQNDSLPTGKVKMAAMNAGGNRNHGNPAGGRRRGR